MVSLNDRQDGHTFSKTEQWSSYENCVTVWIKTSKQNVSNGGTPSLWHHMLEALSTSAFALMIRKKIKPTFATAQHTLQAATLDILVHNIC